MQRKSTHRERRACVVFGPFEVHTSAGHLYKSGIRVPLSGQPFQILLLLLANRGEFVTRERLRKEIWGDGTFVDFEHSLNAAVNKLRRQLGDSAELPKYIETLTGCGYRFIGSIQECVGPASAIVTDPAAVEIALPNGSAGDAKPTPNSRARARERWILAAMLPLIVALAATYHYSHRSLRLTSQDTIVIADPANTTGDPVFDGTVKQGLAI
jgi:DNA-binding winged helix-turn-helix (wHTH) protein